MAAAGLIVAAPASGSGKTVLTLGLLRALRRGGARVVSAKVGPDYIDPAFHAAATRMPCVSLDTWAMRGASLDALIAGLDGDMAVVEGVMGLFDGAPVQAPRADGSTASLAARTGWPVVLVLDVTGQAASAAAVARGFATHRPDVAIAGIVLNRVGGPRHTATLRAAIAAALPEVPVLGCVPRDTRLDLPHRHLGLVQAAEHATLDAFLDAAADAVEAHVDTAALRRLARPAAASETANRPLPPPLLPPLGRHIAVARDTAFAFAYPAQLAAWQAAGARLSLFSPLADDGPAPDADAVFLPGGYPELHAGRLAANTGFLGGLRTAAGRGAWIYGECGGYMVLGETLTDADGATHRMAGLLPVATSFARRRLHLGYRRAELVADTPFGPAGTPIRGHEFHYATVTAQASDSPLFRASDATGGDMGTLGLVRGRVFGSFVHAIDREYP